MSVTLANQRVSQWLADLDKALSARDVAAALALFQEDCFWRDLVAFTWNIKTMEGKDEMPRCSARRCPTSSRPTGASRARRLRPTASPRRGSPSRPVPRRQGPSAAEGRQVLDAADDRKRAQGLRGKSAAAPAHGVTHGVVKNRKTWLERKTEEEAELGFTRQPYCVIIGGGQGGIGLGARLKRLDVPTHHHREERARRRFAGGTATSRSACTIPSGTTTCPTCRSPITGRCSRPRTRSAIGWRCTSRSWS